jgi:transcriptional regulator NrdR family protein
MVCLYCGSNLAVSNSRPQKSRNQVWRRRPCSACKAVFTSTEALDLSQALTVEHEPQNGELQPFDRDRLFISLYESLRHRPSSSLDARGLADTVTAHIIKTNVRGRIQARTIRDVALDTLQHFDKAAASHYAAFHPK